MRAQVDGSDVNLSWNHSDDDAAFEVSVRTGGASTVLTTTGEQGYTFSGLEEGTTYTFSVVAVTDTQRSDPASVSVEVAAASEEEPAEEPETPEEPPAEEPEEPEEKRGFRLF